MEKMRMESEDMQQDNVRKIAALFPNCVTEGDEVYEFTWAGKKASIVEANRPIR